MTEQELKSLTEKINKLAWVNRALEYQIDLNKKVIIEAGRRINEHMKSKEGKNVRPND